jgi:hypothetical protein
MTSTSDSGSPSSMRAQWLRSGSAMPIVWRTAMRGPRLQRSEKALASTPAVSEATDGRIEADGVSPHRLVERDAERAAQRIDTALSISAGPKPATSAERPCRSPSSRHSSRCAA